MFFSTVTLAGNFLDSCYSPRRVNFLLDMKKFSKNFFQKFCAETPALKNPCACCKITPLPKGLQSRNGEEVIALDTLIEFLKHVGANVVSYFVCKWLDKLLTKR